MPDSAPLRNVVAARMKEAMKGGEKVRVGALRLIMAALKEREIEARAAGKIVSRADELALLTKMVKSRQESPRSTPAPGAPSSPSRKTRRSPSSTNSCPSRWTSRR